jgi:hypothetical protein
MTKRTDIIKAIHEISEPENKAPCGQVASTEQYWPNLPIKIKVLLELSAGIPNNDCVAHTSLKDLLR